MVDRVDDTEQVQEPDDIVYLVKQRWTDARKGWSDWRTEARECFDIVSGRQFNEAELAYLEKQKRPPTVFNRVGPVIDAVCGSEAQNRQAIKYAPREINDTGIGELLTNSAAWVRDRSNADIEENDAFRDALICGYGCTVTRVAYAENPDGEIEIERVDPLSVYPDPASIKRNFADARWVIAERWVSGPDLKEQWPGKWEDIGGMSQDDPLSSAPASANIEGEDYEKETSAHYRTRTDEYRLLECEWREAKPYFRVLDPATNKIIDVDAKRWAQMRKAFMLSGMPEPKVVKATKWVWRRSIICGDILLDDGPAPAKVTRSYKFITGIRDRNQHSFYGLVRAMIDPQKWANKFLSQILHIINANAKGGVMWETGAFDNPKTAREEWGKPDAWVQMTSGGLQKVEPRQAITYPAGLDQLMQLSMSSIRDVTGVNLEILGMADRQQAGILEAQRKQAALTILAGWFDALRAYRREHGKLMFHMIKDYISDGRIIRIDGDNGPRNIQLLRAPDTLEFDIIVDSAPASVNVKQQTFETLQMIVPQMAKLGMPVPPSVLKYLPIPDSLAVEWMKLINDKMGGPAALPPEVQQQMQQGMQQIQMLTSEIQARDAALQKMQQESQMMQNALDQAKLANANKMQEGGIKALEAQVSKQQVEIDAYRAETERMKAVQEAQRAEDDRQRAVLLEIQQREIEPQRQAAQQAQIEQVVMAAVKPMAQQIMQMVQEALNAPKTLEYGPDGLVSGMNGRPIVRAPDGRIVGLQ